MPSEKQRPQSTTEGPAPGASRAKQPPGIQLLAAVWKHVNASRANARDFAEHPAAVARSIGADTRSSKEEIESLVQAFAKAKDALKVSQHHVHQ